MYFLLSEKEIWTYDDMFN